MDDWNYYIKKHCFFLGVSFWKSVVHTECGMSESHNTVTYFKTQNFAEDFVKNILCKNKPVDGWVESTVNELQCNA